MELNLNTKIGTTFSFDGKKFRVTDIITRRKSYPIAAEDENGDHHKFKIGTKVRKVTKFNIVPRPTNNTEYLIPATGYKENGVAKILNPEFSIKTGDKLTHRKGDVYEFVEFKNSFKTDKFIFKNLSTEKLERLDEITISFYFTKNKRG